MITLIFILILGVLIFVHELGHFITAKLAGVKVEEFAFGFPPRIFSIRHKETRYSINLFPLGGYVKLLGEDGTSKDHRAFVNKPVIARLLVIVAGVVMNLVLAIVILTIGFMIGMTPLQVDPASLSGEKQPIIFITHTVENSTAQKAGLQSGDRIISIKSLETGKIESIDSVKEVQQLTKQFSNTQIEIKVLRQQKEVLLSGKLGSGEAPLGVGLVETSTVKLGLIESFKTAVIETYKAVIAIFVFLGVTLKTIFASGKVAQEISGPVGIYSLTAQAVKMGFVFILQLTAILSINLAVLNFIPFPALDGGRALFIALEGIFKKKVIREQAEAMIHTVGFILLILLLLAITVRDIVRLQ